MLSLNSIQWKHFQISVSTRCPWFIWNASLTAFLFGLCKIIEARRCEFYNAKVTNKLKVYYKKWYNIQTENTPDRMGFNNNSYVIQYLMDK